MGNEDLEKPGMGGYDEAIIQSSEDKFANSIIDNTKVAKPFRAIGEGGSNIIIGDSVGESRKKKQVLAAVIFAPHKLWAMRKARDKARAEENTYAKGGSVNDENFTVSSKILEQDYKIISNALPDREVTLLKDKIQVWGGGWTEGGYSPREDSNLIDAYELVDILKNLKGKSYKYRYTTEDYEPGSGQLDYDEEMDGVDWGRYIYLTPFSYKKSKMAKGGETAKITNYGDLKKELNKLDKSQLKYQVGVENEDTKEYNPIEKISDLNHGPTLEYAKGGSVSDKRQYMAEFMADLMPDDYLEELGGNATYKDGVKWELENRIKTEADAEYYGEKYESSYITGKEYAKGGEIDLFENYKILPQHIREIMDFYMDKYDEGTYDYNDSKEFLEKMEKEGYTFEYGLDNEPYNLRKMHSFAEGGEVSLYFNQGSSDKEYHIQLQEVDGGYIVNFQYGRRGSSLKAGTKTPAPVSLPEAQKIYDKLINSKVRKGYIVDTSTQTNSADYSSPPGMTIAPKTVHKLPQLLNIVFTEKEFINDDSYLAQEKRDGERRMVVMGPDGIAMGLNKKGQEVPLPNTIINSIDIECTIDGEIIGDTLYAFDILSIMGEDLEGDPCIERISTLNTIHFGEGVIVVETAYNTEEKQKMFDKLKRENREGIVFKKKDAPYTVGRPNAGGNQLKYKFYKTATFIVANLTPGKRSVGLELIDNGQRKFMGKVTIPPNKEIPNVGDLVEVRYLYAYKDGAVYQPTYIWKREDSDLTDATIDQIIYKPEDFAKGGKITDYHTALGKIVMETGKNPKLAQYKTKTGIKVGEIKDLGKDGVIKLANSLNTYAKGGALSKEFKFDKNFVIYVPSTSDVGNKISQKELDKRVDEVERFVTNEFGGYTETDTDGGYKANSGEIIEEDIVKVSVFAGNKEWKTNENQVVAKVKQWAKEWGQEAIGFEYEGDLYYIDDKGKFAKGGKIKSFISEWGQSDETIKSELGYDKDDDVDDILMEDYFWYDKESVWIPKSSSLYSDKEQVLADKLRYTYAKGGKIDTDFLSYKVIQILKDREIESEERIDEAIDYVFF